MLDNAQGIASQNTRTGKLQVQEIQNIPSSIDQDMDLQNFNYTEQPIKPIK